MQVYVNRSLDVQTVGKIRTECDLSYVPRVGFPLNRTVVNMANKIAVQLDINCNICEVIVDGSKVELFKNLMLQYTVDFLIDSMKKMMPVKVLNEIGFKLNVYVPQTCDVTLFSNMIKSDSLESSTIFSIPLSSPHHKFTLPLRLTDQYSLISVHTTNFQSFTQSSTQPQSYTQSQSSTQPHTFAQHQSSTQPQTFAQPQSSTQPQTTNFQSFTQPQSSTQPQSYTQQQNVQSTHNPFGNVDGPGFSFGGNTSNYSFGSQNPQNNTQFGTPSATPPFSGFGAFAAQPSLTFGNISTPPFTGFGSFK